MVGHSCVLSVSVRLGYAAAMVTGRTRPFGTLPDGRSIEQYSIASDAVELCAINFGGIISSLRVPDRDGNFGDVVLGHARLEPYLENPAYLGAVIGRYANRIADGRFRLDGVSHQLTTNEMKNHLHGGTCGFDQRIWTATLLTSPAVGVRFTRTSHAGEEGYPGTLRVSTTYCVTSSGTIVLQYDAFTDAPTIVNLTQHTYFNLTAQPNASVLDHELRIYSEDYIPVGVTRVPTGEVAGVQGTPFNFRTPTRIAAALAMEHDQLRVAGGFDHTFVISRARTNLATAARLSDPSSGRSLIIRTTEPGVHFYAGQLLDGRSLGAHGRLLGRHAGLCLETQHFPDSPNHPQFPSVTLRPGERYQSTTTWRFMRD